jgi:hypothetical protein
MKYESDPKGYDVEVENISVDDSGHGTPVSEIELMYSNSDNSPVDIQ